VAFVRNGQIVDKDELSVLADITAILKQLNAVVEQIEARVRVLERINVVRGEGQL
jgi:hypothetical protein